MSTNLKPFIITPERKQRIEEIAKKYDLKLVVLFGSQVTGRLHSESDVDIAILPSKKDFGVQLMPLLGDFVMLAGDRADVSNIRMMYAPVLRNLIDHCQVVYTKDPLEFHRLESYALQKYAESKPLFAMRNESLKKFLKMYDQQPIHQRAH